jgi:hypothetical protein
MLPRHTVIFGATSAIAQAVAKLFCLRGDRLFLVGRQSCKLEAMVRDLEVRGGQKINFICADLTDFSTHAAGVHKAIASLGRIDQVLIAQGSLSEQKVCEASFAETQREWEINLLSVVSLLTLWGNFFEQQGFGTLAVISSVAGDCGRKRNYVYGAAKAGLNVFLQGLRDRMRGSAVKIITIKPGFIDTPMTQALQKNFLWSQPQTIAKPIVRAMDKGSPMVYVPYFWRYIMFLVKGWYWLRRI